MMMTTAASIAASANNAQVVKKMSVSSAMDNMTAEQKSRIEPKYLSKICDNQQFITNKINQLKDCVMGNTTVRTERYITGYRTVNNIPSGCTVTSSFFRTKKCLCMQQALL